MTLEHGSVQAVVLLSGGIDSVTLLHFVKNRLGVRRVMTLSFHYGQKHSRELAMARYQAQEAGAEHREVDLSFFGDLVKGASVLTDPDTPVPSLDDVDLDRVDQPPTYVPHRNIVLLSLAAACAEAAGAPEVFYGAQQQDMVGYWDCTAMFVARINCVLSLNRDVPVVVRAPFVEKSKSDVLKIGLEIGVDYSHTWSCYRGGDAPCCVCPSCREREKAFRAVGIADPL